MQNNEGLILLLRVRCGKEIIMQLTMETYILPADSVHLHNSVYTQYDENTGY